MVTEVEGGGRAPTARQHMYQRGDSDAIPEESTKLESTRARPSAGFLVEEFHFPTDAQQETTAR